MSMEINEKVRFEGNSKIDGVTAETYSATIDKENPSVISFTRIISQSQAQLRKDNREQCRRDQAAFEDSVYAAQDEMLDVGSVTENLEDEIEEVEEAEETEEPEENGEE